MKLLPKTYKRIYIKNFTSLQQIKFQWQHAAWWVGCWNVLLSCFDAACVCDVWMCVAWAAWGSIHSYLINSFFACMCGREQLGIVISPPPSSRRSNNISAAATTTTTTQKADNFISFFLCFFFSFLLYNFVRVRK